MISQSMVDSVFMVHAHGMGYDKLITKISRENERIEFDIESATVLKLTQISLPRMLICSPNQPMTSKTAVIAKRTLSAAAQNALHRYRRWGVVPEFL